ncbi:hypothetical protein IBTHAUMO2_740004 [Nitrosopumilaceae archaeon]|nr:hypothetical protein [Alphaproteobacteria bacterium]CAI9832369.1 hypothetical protein IBTHAUMO2_740004 [Nitrosopumilaceae archaeon]
MPLDALAGLSPRLSVDVEEDNAIIRISELDPGDRGARMTEEVIKYSTANSTGGRMDAGRKAG